MAQIIKQYFSKLSNEWVDFKCYDQEKKLKQSGYEIRTIERYQHNGEIIKIKKGQSAAGARQKHKKNA